MNQQRNSYITSARGILARATLSYYLFIILVFSCQYYFTHGFLDVRDFTKNSHDDNINIALAEEELVLDARRDDPGEDLFINNLVQKEFVDVQLQNVQKLQLYSLHDLSTINNENNNNDDESISLQENSPSDTNAKNIQFDARSGHIASLVMSTPLLPGKGMGNNLLWSVGTAAANTANVEFDEITIDGDDDIISMDEIQLDYEGDINGGSEEYNGAPTTTREWELYAEQAIQHWVADNQNVLQIDPSQLFGDTSDDIIHSLDSSNTSNTSPNKINTAVHSNGELIQIYIPRTHNSIPIIGSHATASIHQGNLIHFGLEKWEDIDEESFEERPSINVEGAFEKLVEYVGLLGEGNTTELFDEMEFWCMSELQILTRATVGDAASEYDSGNDDNTKEDYNTAESNNAAAAGNVSSENENNGDSRIEGSNDFYMNTGGRRQQRRRRGLGASFTSANDDINNVHSSFTSSAADNTDNNNDITAKMGNGYSHHLIWRICPKFTSNPAEKMEAYIDAHTGQIYSFKNKVDFMQIKGSVFPTSNDGMEPDGVIMHEWPMPYMDVVDEEGNTHTTDHGGNIPYLGDQSVSATFDGPYVTMNDACGSSELAGSWDLNWGTSDGSDCKYCTMCSRDYRYGSFVSVLLFELCTLQDN